jgi:(S)-mandelate dehydrogenase
MADLSDCYNIADIRRAAKRRLPKSLFEFIDRATEDEIAVRNNRDAIERIRIMPRAPLDVSNRVLETEIFGRKAAMPMAIAPTGAAGLMWFHAELELAKAAQKAGIPYTMATGSMTAFETVANQAGGRLWFQLYVWPDRDVTYDIVKRVASAGAECLQVTVDTPVPPNREYNTRNGFGIPFKPSVANVTDMLLHPRWLFGTFMKYWMEDGMPKLRNHPPEFNDPAKQAALAARYSLSANVDLDEIKRLRDIFPGKLLVKGIMHPQDALDVVAAGADGVVVSNHGGRNLDAAVATFDALPGIAAAIGGKATIIVDSGIRRGLDILKAVALGADAVQTGRATLWGAAAGGEAGVTRVLDLLRHELSTAMANAGARTVQDINRGLLAG